jgi:hypothetical protein
MTNINKILCGLCLYAITCRISALPFYSEPYFGVEAIKTNQHFKSRYGKKVFNKNMMNYEALAGFKFNREFGLELGYEVQPKKNNNVVLIAGDALPGMSLITAGNTVKSSSSVSGRHKNLGIFAEFKETFFKVKFRFQLLVGGSYSTVNARTYANSTITTYKKSKLVPRVKFSVIYPIKEKLGVKLALNYRHMEAFNIRSTQQIGSSRVKLNDAFGASLGLVYIFTYT